MRRMWSVTPSVITIAFLVGSVAMWLINSTDIHRHSGWYYYGAPRTQTQVEQTESYFKHQMMKIPFRLRGMLRKRFKNKTPIMVTCYRPDGSKEDVTAVLVSYLNCFNLHISCSPSPCHARCLPCSERYISSMMFYERPLNDMKGALCRTPCPHLVQTLALGIGFDAVS